MVAVLIVTHWRDLKVKGERNAMVVTERIQGELARSAEEKCGKQVLLFTLASLSQHVRA